MSEEAAAQLTTPDNIKDVKWECGFILPNGDFYACNYMCHNDLIQDLHYDNIIPSTGTIQYDYPERNGWIKLCGDGSRSLADYVFELEFQFEYYFIERLPKELNWDSYKRGLYDGTYWSFNVNDVKQQVSTSVEKQCVVEHEITPQQVNAIIDYCTSRNKKQVGFNGDEYWLKDLLEAINNKTLC